MKEFYIINIITNF